MNPKEIADEIIDMAEIHAPESYDYEKDGEYVCPYDGKTKDDFGNPSVGDGYQEWWLCVPCFRDRIADAIKKVMDESYQRGVSTIYQSTFPGNRDCGHPLWATQYREGITYCGICDAIKKETK